MTSACPSEIARYPALAAWIEQLANAAAPLSLADWNAFVEEIRRALEQAAAR